MEGRRHPARSWRKGVCACLVCLMHAALAPAQPIRPQDQPPPLVLKKPPENEMPEAGTLGAIRIDRTGALLVRIAILGSCGVEPLGDITMAPMPGQADRLAGIGGVDVTCSDGQAYLLAIRDTHDRTPVSFFADAGHTIPWNQGLAEPTVSSVGTGVPERFPIYAEMSAQALGAGLSDGGRFFQLTVAY